MDVKLQVVLDSVDRMTAPMHKALGASQKLSPAINKIQSDIARLNQQQKEISGFRQLTQQMQQTDQQVNQSNRALIKLEQQIRHTDVPTQTMLRAQEKLERSHAKLLQKQKSQQQSHAIYQKELKQSGIDIKRLDVAEEQLQATLQKSQNTLKKQSSAYNQARQNLIDLNKTQKKLDGFQKLSNQLENTQVALKHQGNEVARLQHRFDTARKPTQKLTQQLQKASDKLGQLTLKEQQAKQNLEQLKHELNDAGVSTNSLAQSQQTLRQKTNSANAELQRQTKLLQQNTARQQAANQARRNMDRSLQTLSDISLIAGPSMQIGRGMVKGAAAPVKTAMSFEKEMSKVAALTRLDKTDTNYQRLETQSRDMGATTSFSAVEVAQGQQFMAMAGFNNKQIEGAMGGVLDLAKASGKDLARVADISSNILSGFGLKAEEMGRVGDVLTATFTRTNVDLGMLGYSMKYAAPIARQLGVSLEEAAAMSGLLGNVGIQGSQAGTSMRGIFNRLAAQPKPVAASLKDLGIKAKDSKNNLRPVIEILGEVATKTKDMGSADRATHFKNIAGMEAGSAFAELVTQQGAEGITKFVKVLEDSQGEARAVAQKMADNLDGDMTTLSSAYQDAQISMGNIFLPTLRSVVQWVTEATRSIGQWIQRNPQLVETLTTIALVIGTVIAAMGGLSLVLVAVLGPIAMMRYALRMTMLQLAPMSAAVRRFGASLMLLARNTIPVAVAAMRGLSLAMIANPVGLAVAAMVVGASLLVYHWDKVKRFFSGFWGGLSRQFIEPFSRLIPTISNSFADAIAPLKAAFDPLIPMFDWLSNQYQAAKQALGNLFGSVSDVGKAGDSMGATLGQKLLKSVTSIIFETINLLAKAVKFLAPYLSAFVDGFATEIQFIAPIILKTMKIAGSALLAFADIIGSVFGVAWRIIKGLGLMFSDLLNFISPVFGEIGNGILALLTDFGKWLGIIDDSSDGGLGLARSLGTLAAAFTSVFVVAKAIQLVASFARSLWRGGVAISTFGKHMRILTALRAGGAIGRFALMFSPLISKLRLASTLIKTFAGHMRLLAAIKVGGMATQLGVLLVRLRAASAAAMVFARHLIMITVIGTKMAISNLAASVAMLGRRLWAASAAALTFVGRMLLLSAVSGAMAFSALWGSFIMIGRAIGFMGMMLMANPIVLIVAGIAAAAYLIYSNWGTLKTWFSSFWDTIKPAFSMAWEFIKTLFAWSPLGLIITHWDSVMAWFSALPAKFTNFGSMLMDGLANGITSGVKMVKDKVIGIGQKVKAWFTGETQIKSPSRVFMQYGGYINEGLAIGLQQSEQLPIKQSVKIAKILPKGVAKAANDNSIAQPAINIVKQLTAATLIAGASSLPLAAAQPQIATAPHTATQQSMQSVAHIMPPEQMQAVAEQRTFMQEATAQQAVPAAAPSQPSQGFSDQSSITVNVTVEGGGDLDEYRLAEIIRQEIEREKRDSDYRRRTQQFDGHGSL